MCSGFRPDFGPVLDSGFMVVFGVSVWSSRGVSSKGKYRGSFPLSSNTAFGSSSLKVPGMVSKHINPYLLDGIKGVEDNGRIVDDATGDRLYMRVDMPGVDEKNVSVRLENGVSLFCVGKGSLEHPFDEGGRTYAFGFMHQCTCCKFVDEKHAMKHGVLRVSCRRRTTPGSSSVDCNAITLGRPFSF